MCDGNRDDHEESGDNGNEREYSIDKFITADRRSEPFHMISEIKASQNSPLHWKRPLQRVHCGKSTLSLPAPCEKRSKLLTELVTTIDASENTHTHRLPIIRPDDAEELLKGRIRCVR
jgi:hypothetical protein